MHGGKILWLIYPSGYGANHIGNLLSLDKNFNKIFSSDNYENEIITFYERNFDLKKIKNIFYHRLNQVTKLNFTDISFYKLVIKHLYISTFAHVSSNFNIPVDYKNFENRYSNDKINIFFSHYHDIVHHEMYHYIIKHLNSIKFILLKPTLDINSIGYARQYNSVINYKLENYKFPLFINSNLNTQLIINEHDNYIIDSKDIFSSNLLTILEEILIKEYNVTIPQISNKLHMKWLEYNIAIFELVKLFEKQQEELKTFFDKYSK